MICTACPAYAQCYRGNHPGTPRMIRIGPHDARLREHRCRMATDEAAAIGKQRQGLIEPVFGILKERMGARRWLLRGLQNDKAERTMLAIAFNLRALAKVWATDNGPGSPDSVSVPV